MDDILFILENSTFDLNGCIRNCSNRGQCPFATQFTCVCDPYFLGPACQTDTRPCAVKEQCMHQGQCGKRQNFTGNYSLECQCENTFNGLNCENLVDVCQNEKCSSQGSCWANENNEARCKCFVDYSGDKCENANTMSKVIKYAKISSLTLFLSTIGVFIILIVVNDILNCISPSVKGKDKKKRKERELKKKIRHLINSKK